MKTILVIDDSGIMLRSMKSWLEDKYKVALANSGIMAMKYLSMNMPDLILLDYEMPDMNGNEVLKKIRTELPDSDIPVFFLTGKEDLENIVTDFKIEGWLSKSTEQTKLLKQINAFFEK